MRDATPDASIVWLVWYSEINEAMKAYKHRKAYLCLDWTIKTRKISA